MCNEQLATEEARFRTLFKCQDCPMALTACRACVLQDHRGRPFDRIRRWSPEDECWEKLSTADLGHVVYLGHGGACCPKIPNGMDGTPDPQTRKRDITILHEHGIVDIPFVFCCCDNAIEEPGQLLAAGLWPATWDTPESATTLSTLETFYNLSMQAQVNIYDYLEHLKRMTDGVLSAKVKVRI